MAYRVKTSIFHNSKTFNPGDLFDVAASSEQVRLLVEAGALEEAEAAFEKAEVTTGSTMVEDEPEESKTEGVVGVKVSAKKTKDELLEIAQTEGVEADETMTKEEIVLAINKARNVS